ncbi:MAG: hypothetical protein ACREPR_20980 [Brasilonema sp.]
MICYQTTLDGITASMLTEFFVGWRSPHTSERHYQILKNSNFIVLAVDTTTLRVVGFITCISDGIQSRFIPLVSTKYDLLFIPNHQIILPRYQ